LNRVINIDNFQFFYINQIKGENYYPGVLSLNKKIHEYNLADEHDYDEIKLQLKNILAFVWILVKEKIMIFPN